MKSELFQHEMTETSAIFGREEKIEVVFKGDGAFTDGKKINLPSFAHGVDVDQDTMSVMRGYTDHEAGHVRHTDFNEVNRFGAKDCVNPDGTQNKTLFGLANAIEDIWLEKRVFKDYPGAEKNVAATASSVNKSFCDREDAAELAKDWLAVLGVAITWEGRKDYDGIQHATECLDLLDEDLREKLTGWVEKIKDSKNTSDNTKLAKEIYDEVKDEAEKRKPKPQENKGEGEGEGKPIEKPHGEEDDAKESSKGVPSKGVDRGTGEEQETDEGVSSSGVKECVQPEKDDAGVPEGGAETKPPDPRTGDDTEGDEDAKALGGVGPSEDWGKHEPFDHSFGEAVERVAKEIEKSVVGNVYKPYTTEFDVVFDKNSGVFQSWCSNRGEQWYKQKLDEQTGTANVIRRKIERALSAKMNRGWDQGREFGRLDNKRLVGAYNGQTNVYKEREPVAEMDTAVTLLVDCSGSMDGRPLALAQEVSIALAEAVDRTMVVYEILGFTNNVNLDRESYNASRPCGDDRLNNYARVGVLTGYVFKSFDESLRLAKASIGAMTSVATAANVDGESVLWALNRLHKRKEKRKVLLVLSDGYPASSDWLANSTQARPMSDDQHLRYAVNRAKEEGVDCIGIGIQSSAVSRFYPDYVVVNSLADLEKEALGKLAKALLGERYEVDNSKLLKVKNVAA